MRVVVMLFALAACYQPNAAECQRTSCATDGNVETDAPSDGDVGPNTFCAGAAAGLLGSVCFEGPFTFLDVPSGTVRSLDTGFDTDCQPTSPMGTCFVIVDQINGTLRATGPNALVLWSPATLVIAGIVDVASRGAAFGAGVPSSSCPLTSTIQGGFDSLPVGAGGAGGSFGVVGGVGGSVGGTQANGAPPIPLLESALTLHGGCPGGAGGNDAVVENGGRGGGAVYVMAGERIAIGGSINASGAGANPATARRGGGGGGSGGMIGLDAPLVIAAGGSILLALGGGGSPGGNATMQGPAGSSPTLGGAFVAPLTPSSGCSGFSAGGASGQMGDNGTTAGTTCGGGGGGGGAGLIQAFQGPLTSSGTVMPPAAN